MYTHKNHSLENRLTYLLVCICISIELVVDESRSTNSSRRPRCSSLLGCSGGIICDSWWWLDWWDWGWDCEYGSDVSEEFAKMLLLWLLLPLLLLLLFSSGLKQHGTRMPGNSVWRRILCATTQKTSNNKLALIYTSLSVYIVGDEDMVCLVRQQWCAAYVILLCRFKMMTLRLWLVSH